MLPHLIPTIVALAVTSLVVLVSNSFSGLQKIIVQSSVFGFGLAVSVVYLFAYSGDGLSKFWESFVALTPEVRFVLAIVMISVTYFGGAMYVASPEKSHESKKVEVLSSFPASCDKCVSFDVPLVIPSDDKIFFEEFLEMYDFDFYLFNPFFQLRFSDFAMI